MNYEQLKEMKLKDFMRKFICNPRSKLYVNQSSIYPSLEKTIEIIHTSKGLAFLAHLYEYSANIAQNLNEIISKYNLDGMECFYTSFTDEQSSFLSDFCKKKHLYMSSGSDFHGAKIKPNEMGLATNGRKFDETIIEEWLHNYQI